MYTDNFVKYLKNKRPTWCHFLFYFTSYVLNTFRTLIYPSSGACDYSVELPHWSYCLGLMWVGVSVWLDRKLLMMDILMSETCRAHKKWNKITSDINLVSYSSTITMMHGPISIRFVKYIFFAIVFLFRLLSIIYLSIGEKDIFLKTTLLSESG